MDYHVVEMAVSDCSSEKGECSSSLLDRLAELARKCKVKANPPVGVNRSQRRSLLSHTYNPKSILPTQHVNEFPDERLTVSGSSFSLRIIGDCLGNNFFFLGRIIGKFFRME